jgi:hypothetical protein
MPLPFDKGIISGLDAVELKLRLNVQWMFKLLNLRQISVWLFGMQLQLLHPGYL